MAVCHVPAKQSVCQRVDRLDSGPLDAIAKGFAHALWRKRAPMVAPEYLKRIVF